MFQFEYMEKKGYPLTFGKDKMEEKYPTIPYQQNSSDCGIFLLHYIELVFKVSLSSNSSKKTGIWSILKNRKTIPLSAGLFAADF